MSFVDMRDGVLTRTIGELTGSKNKAGAFVRRHVIPHDPQSAVQLNRRLRMQDLSKVVSQAYRKGVAGNIYPPLKQTSYLSFMIKGAPLFLAGGSNNPNLWSIASGRLRTPPGRHYSISESLAGIHIEWNKRKRGEQTDDTKVRAFFWNRNREDSILSDVWDWQDNEHDIPHNWTQGDIVFAQLYAYNIGVSTSFPWKEGKSIGA